MNVCHTFFQNNPGKIISRFNFNSLFSQAWLRAVNPANIIGGFKRSGVYPYDPSAVRITGGVQTQSPQGSSTGSGSSSSVGNQSLDQTSTQASNGSTSEVKGLDGNISVNGGASVRGNTNGKASKDGDDLNSSHHHVDTFTPKQLELFECRWEEGYDLLNDPDYVYWLKLHHREAITDPSHNGTPSPSASSSKSSSVTPKTPPQPPPSKPLIVDASTPKQSSISKYLTTPTSSNASSKPVPKARLLTSADALALLEEKEK